MVEIGINDWERVHLYENKIYQNIVYVIIIVYWLIICLFIFVGVHAYFSSKIKPWSSTCETKLTELMQSNNSKIFL